MTDSVRPKAVGAPTERPGTLIETDEDIKRALRGEADRVQELPAPEEPVATPQETVRPAISYRPTSRPPFATLTVFDDGQSEGEVIRLRGPQFIIGRTQGNLSIPLDSRISSRHIQISHQVVGGRHRWVVTDLQSRHGLFVRVKRGLLIDGSEFQVGNGRYHLELPEPLENPPTVDQLADDPTQERTHNWSDPGAVLRPPALTEIIGSEIGSRTVLLKHEYWIGTDATVPICRPDDPFCEPRHARLYRTPKGQWFVEHTRASNGLWLRMSQVLVETNVQFMIGEQRFLLKVM